MTIRSKPCWRTRTSSLKRAQRHGQVTSPEKQLITPPDFCDRAKPKAARTANPNRRNRQPHLRRTAKTAKPKTPCFASVSRNRHNRQNRQSRQVQLFYEGRQNQKPPKPPSCQPSLPCSSAMSPCVHQVWLCLARQTAKEAHSAPVSTLGEELTPSFPEWGWLYMDV